MLKVCCLKFIMSWMSMMFLSFCWKVCVFILKESSLWVFIVLIIIILYVLFVNLCGLIFLMNRKKVC